MLHACKREQLVPLQTLIGGAAAGPSETRDLIDWFDHCTRLSESA